MFDLITGNTTHIPRHQTLPMLFATAAQVAIIAAVLIVPLLWMTDELPQIPSMMAFVVAPPAPPPPPPPPAPAVRKAAPATARPVPTSARAAPLEPPSRVEPELLIDEGFDQGFAGGAAGGIPGGVVGGVLGGLLTEIPPPPPPPPPPPLPPPASRKPVRTGGQVGTPALLHRVDPEYPELAVRSKMQGRVILEALVDEDGRVVDVKLLRSAGEVLDRAAIAAVRQWHYSPLLLNGIRERFILTVTLAFNLADAR